MNRIDKIVDGQKPMCVHTCTCRKTVIIVVIPIINTHHKRTMT